MSTTGPGSRPSLTEGCVTRSHRGDLGIEKLRKRPRAGRAYREVE